MSSLREWNEPLARRLAIKRCDARDGHLGLIESERNERFLDLQRNEAAVDLRLRDDAYVCSACCLPYLVLDDLSLLAEGRSEHVGMDAHTARVDEGVVETSLRIGDPAERRSTRASSLENGHLVGHLEAKRTIDAQQIAHASHP